MKQSKLSINFSKCSHFPGQGRWKDKYWTKGVVLYLKHLNEYKKLYNIFEECFCLVSTAPFSKPVMRSWPLMSDQFFRVILDDLLHAQRQGGFSPWTQENQHCHWYERENFSLEILYLSEKRKYPLLDGFMTFATDFCDMGRSRKSLRFLSFSCLLRTFLTIVGNWELLQVLTLALHGSQWYLAMLLLVTCQYYHHVWSHLDHFIKKEKNLNLITEKVAVAQQWPRLVRVWRRHQQLLQRLFTLSLYLAVPQTQEECMVLGEEIKCF